ncbi:MAG: L,D-transpeptidase family protein [Solirubrobacteraceae bacterium]
MRIAILILVSTLVVLLVAGVGGIYAYDSSRDDAIAEGVSVNGVALGGLSAEQARAKLERSILPSLRQPVSVERGDETFRLSPRRARVTVNVDAAVDEAVERSREGNMLSRTWRDLSGEEAQASIPPTVKFSSRAVGRFVEKVRRETDRTPRDATIQPDAAQLEKVGSQMGVKLQARALRRDVERALAGPKGDRTIRARTKRVEPAVTTAELAGRYPTYLTIDRPSFKLRLYKNLKLEKAYPIALGAAGRETPAGLYDIANKQVDPVWSVPNSDWAGALAGRQIPPGPANPLKARWLGVYNGVGIHGTAERQSIGTNASKGCIRMLVEDVIDLYDRVPVGTPVYIA